MGVTPNLASLPSDLKSGSNSRNTIAYGNIMKFVNDTTECLYQTSLLIIESDIVLKSPKTCMPIVFCCCSDFIQLTLPKDIFPSLRTSCVRYLFSSLTSDSSCSHLLSLSFSDGKSSLRFISVPVQVSALPDYNGTDIYPLFFSTHPIETGSYSLDITDVPSSPSSSLQGLSHARLHHHHRDRKSRGTRRFSSSGFPLSPILRRRVHQPVPHQREPINPRRSLVAPSLLHVVSGLSKRRPRCGILGRAVDAVPRIRDFWNYTKRKGGVQCDDQHEPRGSGRFAAAAGGFSGHGPSMRAGNE